MYLILAMVFKKYLYKSTIDDGGLIKEKIHGYIKFTHITKLNNI